jgi:hypothetical protein
MKNESWLKNVGSIIFGLAAMVAFFLLVGLFLHGIVWVSEKALPWLLDLSAIVFAVCLFILLPASIFRKTRPWAALGLLISSYLFGTLLFAFACIVVTQIWGFIGLVIGLIIAGVGVVPVGILATLIHGEWLLLSCLIVGIVLTYGTRYLSLHLAEAQ